MNDFRCREGSRRYHHLNVWCHSVSLADREWFNYTYHGDGVFSLLKISGAYMRQHTAQTSIQKLFVNDSVPSHYITPC